MQQEPNAPDALQLSILLKQVEQGFGVVKAYANRIADGKEVLCDLSPKGPLAQLALRADEMADKAKPAYTPPNTYLIPDGIANDPKYPNPLKLFSRSVRALRWLVQKHEAKPWNQYSEVNWLAPRFSTICIDDQNIIPGAQDGGGVTHALLADWLAEKCRNGGFEAHNWSVKAENAWHVQSKLEQEQSDKSKAQQERDEWRLRAEWAKSGGSQKSRLSEDVVEFCRKAHAYMQSHGGARMTEQQAITEAWKETPGLPRNVSYYTKRRDYLLWADLRGQLGREPTATEYNRKRPKRGRPRKR